MIMARTKNYCATPRRWNRVHDEVCTHPKSEKDTASDTINIVIAGVINDQ
jgi:hypothetical protein